MKRFKYNRSMTEPLRTVVLFLLHLFIGIVAVATLKTALVIVLFVLGMVVWTSRLYVVWKHYRFDHRKR